MKEGQNLVFYTNKAFYSHFGNGGGHTFKTTRGFKRAADKSILDSNFYNPPQQQQTVQGVSSSITSHRDIRKFAEATLGSGSALAQAVKLPEGEDLNEWLAVHVVDFYNQINMLYGSITEFCSPKTCPKMMATVEYEYLWQDPNLRRPISVSAPTYVENLMNWIQDFFDDETVFPAKLNCPFPSKFVPLVKTIMKRLFRIYAHIYCHHFEEITELGLQTHLNTSLKHFVLFSKEFNLVNDKDFGPLEELVHVMVQSEENH